MSYHERGLAYESFGDDHQRDALADYTMASDMFPRFVFALERRGDIATKLNRVQDAIIAQRQLIIIFPHRLDVLIALGSNYLKLGRADEALAVWDRR